MRLEALAARRVRPEAAAGASGVVHPTHPVALHTKSTAIAPGSNAWGVRTSCRRVRTGIRKVKGARARARNGRRGFDRHCADRLVTTDEEDVKKSDAGRRKKTRPGPFLVVQFATPTAPAVSHTQSSLPLVNLPYGWCTCGVMVGLACARAKEREGSVKAKCVPGLRTSLLDPFDARRSAGGRWAEQR